MTQELNCSDAAKMLIERMKTHPEDFEPDGRFWGVMQHLVVGDGVGGAFSIMSKRDVKAVEAAAQQLYENKLMEYVLHKLLVKDEEARLVRASPQKVMNSVYANVTAQNAAQNSINPYITGGSST